MHIIEDLIPHRTPFLFADHIVEASKDEIIAIKSFDENEPWLTGSFKNSEHRFIPGMILVESMAQCGGAGIKLLGLTDGLFGLAGIETARFLKGASYGQEIKYVIKNVRVSSKLIKQAGVGYVNGEPVVEAAWLCVRLD